MAAVALAAQRRTRSRFVALVSSAGGGATGAAAAQISGGTVTVDATHAYHTFTAADTLTVITGGEVDYLVVGGGGAGGGYPSSDHTGGGGGAGETKTAAGPTLTAGSYLPGIRQVALEFAAQIVTVNAGTSTPVQREATARLALRNRGFLQ